MRLATTLLQRVACGLVGAGLLLALAGCGGPFDAPGADGGDWYRAHLTGREPEQIPFFLRLPDDCATATATIVNGDERIDAACQRGEDGIVIDFPVYGTLIEASFEPGGSLAGHWYRDLPAGREPIMVFEARRIAGPDPHLRFPPPPAEPDTPRSTDVTGTWRMEFNLYGEAKGLFTQQASGVVTGSIEMLSHFGDLRFLAGSVAGERMQLSTFDGQHAFLVEGRVGADDTMEGLWISSVYWDEFVGQHVTDFELADPLARVRLAPGRERLELEALRDPRYAGKAVIVQIFGTWCPNCGDQAPLLTELYRTHHTGGLEILGLAFEYTDDQDYQQRRVAEFKARYGIEWDIVIFESRLADLAKQGLAGLSPIEGVPVTVFVNRDGTVHAVYTGFSGPATGDAHLQAKTIFEQLTREILDGS